MSAPAVQNGCVCGICSEQITVTNGRVGRRVELLEEPLRAAVTGLEIVCDSCLRSKQPLLRANGPDWARTSWAVANRESSPLCATNGWNCPHQQQESRKTRTSQLQYCKIFDGERRWRAYWLSKFSLPPYASTNCLCKKCYLLIRKTDLQSTPSTPSTPQEWSVYCSGHSKDIFDGEGGRFKIAARRFIKMRSTEDHNPISSLADLVSFGSEHMTQPKRGDKIARRHFVLQDKKVAPAKDGVKMEGSSMMYCFRCRGSKGSAIVESRNFSCPCNICLNFGDCRRPGGPWSVTAAAFAEDASQSDSDQ